MNRAGDDSGIASVTSAPSIALMCQARDEHPEPSLPQTFNRGRVLLESAEGGRKCTITYRNWPSNTVRGRSIGANFFATPRSSACRWPGPRRSSRTLRRPSPRRRSRRRSPEAASSSQFALEGGSSVVFDDPHRLGNIPSSNVVRQVAEYLTYSGPDNVAEPFLLESWEPAADLRTWTLRVREGVTFNTGRALDADDVVWNITRWLDEETVSTMRDLMSYMTPEGVEKVDNMTVRLHLDRPSITVPYDLFHYQAVILPRELR